MAKPMRLMEMKVNILTRVSNLNSLNLTHSLYLIKPDNYVVASVLTQNHNFDIFKFKQWLHAVEFTKKMYFRYPFSMHV